METLLDTGCSRTVVHEYLVPKEKVVYNKRVSLRCAHGDLVEYSTAEVEVLINGKLYHVNACVSSALPRPILLG